jgi:F-box interacting protein
MYISVFPPRFGSIDFEAFLNNDPDLASLNINYWLPHSDFPVQIKGSCRGFIFLYCRPDIYIWNPSTGFKIQIPLSPFNIKKYIHLYGFGYDPSRDEYVVVVLSHHTIIANFLSSHLELFSFKDNMWKEIEGSLIPYIGDSREGSLFRETIHWLVFRRDLEIDVIVAFDLMERKLIEMSLPNDFDQEIRMASGLSVLGELLSFWAMDYDNNIVEIWVMKEYKVNLSWTKTLVPPTFKLMSQHMNS